VQLAALEARVRAFGGVERDVDQALPFAVFGRGARQRRQLGRAQLVEQMGLVVERDAHRARDLAAFGLAAE
jgi:hypothetical protein